MKANYIYEGLLVADKNGILPGRIITGKANTLSRQEIANEVRTHVIQTSLIYQLNNLYASQTTSELSSFLALVRSPFDFQTYWVQQLLSIDTSVKVTIIDKANFGQMNSAGQRQGLGRQLNKTMLYDGQFEKDVFHGYGRLITLDADDKAKSTVQEGYFL